MAGPYTDPMSFLMQLMNMGNDVVPPGVPGMMGGEGFPGATGPVPSSGPSFAPPPPQPVAAVPTFPGPSFEQGGRMGASAGPVPGLVPGQVAGGPPLPMPKPAQGGAFGPAQFAALQALEAPEDENQGPPSPPAAPSQAGNIDPGMLFEALLRLGVHPGQIPQLSRQLKV